MLVIAGVGATAWAALNVWEANTSFAADRQIGAVSVGLFPSLAGVVAPLILNWSLRGAARRHSPLANRFRHLHLWLTLAYTAWGFLSVQWLFRIGPADPGEFLRIATAISIANAAFLPLQAFFGATALVFFLERRHRSAREGTNAPNNAV